MELLQVIKALSDETRIRIMNLLDEGKLCVCELEELLQINQSNASRHLNKLTNAKLIDYEKSAQYVYYSLNGKTMDALPFINELLKEFAKLEKCQSDIERLDKYKQSGLTCEDLKQGKVCLNNEEVK